MNANFQYIELKDRKQEWMDMSGEDRPNWNYQHLLIIDNYNEDSYCVMIEGLYILQKLSIKDEYNLGDGLGISKQGMIEPIQVTIRKPKCRYGLGFQYKRKRIYPNRQVEFIKWVK